MRTTDLVRASLKRAALHVLIFVAIILAMSAVAIWFGLGRVVS